MYSNVPFLILYFFSDPLCRHPLRLPLEEVDLIEQLFVNVVDVVERDDGVEVVAEVLLHVLRDHDRVAVLVLLQIE